MKNPAIIKVRWVLLHILRVPRWLVSDQVRFGVLLTIGGAFRVFEGGRGVGHFFSWLRTPGPVAAQKFLYKGGVES